METEWDSTGKYRKVFQKFFNKKNFFLWFCMIVRVCVYAYCIEHQTIHSTIKVRTRLISDDIVAGPRRFKGLFEGWEIVLR